MPTQLSVGMIQSSYLPWRGYFDFINSVDLFIIYDDVQYTRRDWRNRNQIKTATGKTWLTVPVNFSRNAPTLIQDTEICYQNNWPREHIGRITSSYRRAPHFEQYCDGLFKILNQRHRTISELNYATISWTMSVLEIKTPVRWSMEFKPEGIKTDRIIDILKKIKATDYVVGPAARDYIETDKFRTSNIGLEFKSYDYPEYPQGQGPFDPCLSIIDLIFNCGPHSKKYLKSQTINEKTV